jgi:hypothetical protein
LPNDPQAETQAARGGGLAGAFERLKYSLLLGGFDTATPIAHPQARLVAERFHDDRDRPTRTVLPGV